MATPFETFISTELPRRVAVLTKEFCGGYEGDPNDPGAPSILQNAPKGTFYLRNTDALLWRKQTGVATSWITISDGSGLIVNSAWTYSGGPPQEFTTHTDFVPGTTLVYWNGERLEPGVADDYIEVPPNIVRLNPAVVYNPVVDKMVIDYAEGSAFATAHAAGSIEFSFDNAGVPLVIGTKGHVRVPYNGTITGWTVLSNAAGNVGIGVNTCNFAGYPVFSSIVGVTGPGLGATQKATSTVLTGWTTAFTAGDIFEFEVLALPAPTVTECQVYLDVIKG